MAHGNLPERWEKVVSRFSKDAVKAVELFICKGHYPCLPVDQNRIIFVTCKDRYRKRLKWPWMAPQCDVKYGDLYNGSNKVLLRCPRDCAVVGSAWDNGKRYNEVKERTRGLKLIGPVKEISLTFLQRIGFWITSWI